MIVKYCRKEHNAHSGSKILIGNLDKYRNIEVAELRDEGEGTFEFSIEFLEGASLHADWANLIFPGFHFGSSDSSITLPGKFSTYIEVLDIESVNGDVVSIRYARVRIGFTAINSLIFCASNCSNSPMETNPFSGYDDFWSVGADREGLDRFASRIGALLLSHLTEENFVEGYRGLSLSDLKRVGIDVRHGPVKYVPRNLVITAEMSRNFSEVISSYLDAAFCKPAKFAAEREYRFSFTPVLGGRILEVANTDLLLDLNTLTSR